MKRQALEVSLAPQPATSPWPLRTVRLSDAENLAILLYAAFRGTVDDEGETFAEARAEIDKTFTNEYGVFLPESSFVIENPDGLAAACLVSWFEPHQAPLVVFSMTHPLFQRQGMGRCLLRRSMNALRAKGYAKLSLIVTEENRAAVSLYRSIGFHEVSGA